MSQWNEMYQYRKKKPSTAWLCAGLKKNMILSFTTSFVQPQYDAK